MQVYAGTAEPRLRRCMAGSDVACNVHMCSSMRPKLVTQTLTPHLMCPHAHAPPWERIVVPLAAIALGILAQAPRIAHQELGCLVQIGGAVPPRSQADAHAPGAARWGPEC